MNRLSLLGRQTLWPPCSSDTPWRRAPVAEGNRPVGFHHGVLGLLLLAAVAFGCRPPAPSASESAQGDASATVQDEEGPPIAEADVTMPSDYAVALQRLRGYRDAVRQAIESGRYHEAHRPLDEMEIVINRLPSIARDSGVPKRYWEQVVVSGEDLSELFNRVHDAIDAHQTPDYAAVAEPIDAALRHLAEVPMHDAKPSVSDSASEVQR